MNINISDYPDNAEQERTFDITITKDDVINLDQTLAHIIHPALIKFNEIKVSFSPVDDEDIVDDGLTDQEKWDYVINEMIYAFGELKNPDADSVFYIWDDEISRYELDESAHTIWWKRVSNGLRLFAKYYKHLWS